MGLLVRESDFVACKQQRSLISAFVIRFLESCIAKLAACNILKCLLVFVAKQAGLTWSQISQNSVDPSYVKLHVENIYRFLFEPLHS